MPFAQVEPDLYLSHNGVEVFHTYKDGLSVSQYWFTTDPATADDTYAHGTKGHFDARYFSRQPDPQRWSVWRDWWTARFRSEEEAIRALICAEIEAGRLPREEGNS